jgi:pentose-5-phosphate-3-epimerase
MHPTAVIDHLAMAERHVTDCHLHVVRQRQIVESLARNGQNNARSSALLELFEELLVKHIQHRDLCRAEAAAIMKQLPGITH